MAKPATRSIVLALAIAVVGGCGGTSSADPADNAEAAEDVPKIVLSQEAGMTLAPAAAASGPDASPSAAAPAGAAAVPVGKDVTDLAYELFEGGTRTLGHYRGQPLVVNFFAAWCPPCVAEMPEFQSAFEELGGEVAFLGLSQDRAAAEALDLVARTGVTYDIGWDPYLEVFSEIGGMAMPTTAFVTAAGELVGIFSGALDEEALHQRIGEIRG